MNGLGGFILILWALAGIVAFFWSVTCFGTNGGSTGQNVIGLLIAIFLGPLWFIYKWLMTNQGYCQNASALVRSVVTSED